VPRSSCQESIPPPPPAQRLKALAPKHPRPHTPTPRPQARIQEGASCHSIRELEADLATAAASYVAVTNAKPAGVYLDVVLPEEYDPLALRGRAVRVETSDLVDPLKRDLLKAQAERELLQVAAGDAATAATGRGGGAVGGAGGGAPRAGGGGATTARSGGSGGSAGPAAAAATRLAPAVTRQMLQTTKWCGPGEGGCCGRAAPASVNQSASAAGPRSTA
jgi:hypothetical protein